MFTKFAQRSRIPSPPHAWSDQEVVQTPGELQTPLIGSKLLPASHSQTSVGMSIYNRMTLKLLRVRVASYTRSMRV